MPSLSIGPRTLLNDCNHSATAVFWMSASRGTGGAKWKATLQHDRAVATQLVNGTRRELRARDKRCDDTGERQTWRNKLGHNVGQNTTQV